jgi:Spy/CpxP family protein refolding chaperone
MATSPRAVGRVPIRVIAVLMVAGLTAVAVQAATSSDAAQGNTAVHSWHGHHHGPVRHFMHVLQQLQLSAEQQTQIKSIFDASRSQFAALATGMHNNAEAMVAMPPTDPGYPALLAAAKANAAARIQQLSDVKTQIFAVLTKAQQEQIPQVLAAERVRWLQRHPDAAPAATAAAPAS